MDTRIVKEFLTFAQDMNYSAAAKKMFITRPTLRQHISNLEQDLSVPLVEQENGVARLTFFGERFLQDGEMLLNYADNVVKKYELMGEQHLTIRTSSVDLMWLEPWIHHARDKFIRENPEKEVNIVLTSKRHTDESLRDQTTDIAVVFVKTWCENKARSKNFVPEGAYAMKIYEEETMLLIPSTNPLYKKEHLFASDLQGENIILPRDIAEWWKRDGVAERLAETGGHITIESRDFSDLSNYFAFNFGTSLGGVSFKQVERVGLNERTDCKAMRIEDCPLVSSFYAAFSSKFLKNKNARKFLECFESVLA